MTDKLIYISNNDTQNSTSVHYNYWLKCLDTQLSESTNQNTLKVPKVVKSTNKKTLLKTLCDEKPIDNFLLGSILISLIIINDWKPSTNQATKQAYRVALLLNNIHKSEALKR